LIRAAGWALVLGVLASVRAAEPSPALRLFHDASVRFYLGFDHATLEADLSNGPPAPLAVSGIPFYRAGLFGRALFMAAGGKVVYDRSHNLPTATEVGTLCFWFKPVGWGSDEGQRPTRTLFRSQYPSAGISWGGRIWDFRDLEPLMYYCNRFLPPDNQMKAEVLSQYAGPLQEGTWCLIVLSWSRHGAALSLNGQKPVSRNLLRPVTEDETRPTADDGRFSFHFDEAMLLDEVFVFDRVLSESEIRQIYESLTGAALAP